MANKFTVKKDLIEVSVDYLENESGDIVVIRNQITKDRIKDKLKNVKAKFVRPTYQLFNAFMEGSLKTQENGETHLDQVIFKSKKFQILLREIEDHDGTKFPVTRELLNDIVPDLAIAFIDEFDRKLDEERFEALKSAGAIPPELVGIAENFLNNVWSNGETVPENEDAKISE